MNFRFTWKSTLIFIVGLVLGSLISVLFDSQLAGFGVIIGVIGYLAQSQK
jgi:hypothetical protein